MLFKFRFGNCCPSPLKFMAPHPKHNKIFSGPLSFLLLSPGCFMPKDACKKLSRCYLYQSRDFRPAICGCKCLFLRDYCAIITVWTFLALYVCSQQCQDIVFQYIVIEPLWASGENKKCNTCTNPEDIFFVNSHRATLCKSRNYKDPANELKGGKMKEAIILRDQVSVLDQIEYRW